MTNSKAMTNRTIISCAVTGAGNTMHLNPAVPVTPEQIANEVIASAKAGAAIAHIHVRHPETGEASVEYRHYEEVVARVRDSGTDVILNLTTGPGAKYVQDRDNRQVCGPGSVMLTPEQRVEHVLRLKPELCTLDIATLNFGNNAVINTIPDLIDMARMVDEAGVRTEIEVFDLGHLRLAVHMVPQQQIPRPSHFQFCLGIPWGAPADTETAALMKHQLPTDLKWSAFAISRQQFPMVAQAFMLGGHVRVGLEDNIYLGRGQLAPGNAALVERCVQILQLLGGEVATPAQAREILGL